MNKKKILKISFLVIIVLIIIFVVLFAFRMYKNKDKSKHYNFDVIESKINKEYDYLSLSSMDDIDILSDFGFSKNEIDNCIFLKTKILNDEVQDVTTLADLNYVILIQDDNYTEYYDMLYSYIDSNLINNEENSEEYKIYDKAVLKKDDKNKFVYMILSKEEKDIVKTIFDNLKIKE